MYNKILLLIVFLFSYSSIFAQNKNLVKNGQFVTGTDGWEILLDDKNAPIKAHIEQGTSYKEYGLADNYIGTNFVELDEKSAIQQKINTRQGTEYLLTFAFAHRPDAGVKQLILTIDGKAVFTTTVSNSDDTGSFAYKKIMFKAKNSSTKIAFYTVSLGGSPEKGVLLTDIHCEKLKEGDWDKYSDMKY